MDLRVVLLFIVTAYGITPEYKPHYKGNQGLEYKDGRGQASNVKPGFVQPLDFDTFTEQFVGEEKGDRAAAFAPGKTSPAFGAESQKSGAFQVPSSEFTSFPGSAFPKENNKTGFVQPVRFGSSFNKETNAKVYKTSISPSYQSPQSNASDQVPKATEGDDYDDADVYFKPSNKFRHSTRPNEPKKSHPHGKSSYPSPGRKSSQSNYYYPPGPGTKSKDVEMILPKDKVLFLPMVNGKPKPYDGYRAAPEGYEAFGNDEESSRLREKRLNEGEIIYGKPKIALSPLYHRQLKRSPAEYFGGIYPYYDYSEAKLSVGGDTDPTAENRGKKSAASNQKKKKTHPSKDKTYNPYKYPKESSKGRNKDEDAHGYASGESSEEVEEEPEEESEETRADKPLYKYTYDDSVRVPPLEIKTYPYEKHLRDSHTEESKRDEYDDNVDEFTDGYERYVKTLPSDLEAYFGSSEVDKYTVEATQNLENNKNCKKIDTAPPKTEENAEAAKTDEEAQVQVCYMCSDPKTGDNYEQCSYRSQPKSQKYFFGGTTSFHTNETAEPTTYRYKRSTFEHPYLVYPYSLQQSESADSERLQQPEDSSEEIQKKPKKKYKKKYKKQRTGASSFFKKKHPKKQYEEYKEYNPFFKLQGAYSSKKGKTTKPEGPPRSYDGPKYTYEGPEETYEGPSRPYEGPKETYEGPAEPYEGPINQEYYDTVDERIQDEEEEESPKQESQSSDLTKSHYYDDDKPKRQKPRKRQSYSSRYGTPYTPSRYYDEDHEESYRPHDGYISDYRFGPEHFVDEGDAEDTKQTEQVKPTASEKRGPQKFSGSEARSASATDKQEKEESVGEVKTFKNGDVCQKKRKEGMICMVCKNEKTAAVYEQCQYSTKPKDKYYAYGTQKSYTTKNPNAEQKDDESESESESGSDSDQFPEKSDIVEKKILITKQSKVFGYDPVPTEGLTAAESNNSPRILPTDLYGDYTDSTETLSDDSNQNDTNSRNFAESIERIEPRDGIEGLEEYLYDAEDSEKKASEEEKRSYRTYDDYFHDLFPEFGKSSEPVPESEEKEESESEAHLSFDPFSNVRQFHEENSRPERYSRVEEEEEEEEKDAEASRPKELRLKDRESRIPRDFFVPYNEEQHKRDLEKALGEFQNRDWSNCKKIVKKKLTCYQCVDKNGVNNEECMYVEASQPITKHLALHEKKELKPAEQDVGNKTIEPTTELTKPENSEKSLRRFRKAKNSPAELIEVAEPPKDAEYVEESKGDYEGVNRLPVDAADAPVVADAGEAVPEQTTPKPKPKKNKRNSKKRHKTRRNETTTERFEKIRKRKFPLKKFNDSGRPPTESPPEEGSFGEKSTEATTLAPNLNQTVANATR